MVHLSLFVVATVGFGILEANASPCRPKTVTSLTEGSVTATSGTTTVPTSLSETAVTSLTETLSTALSETELTSLTTSIPTSLSETTSIIVAETTTTTAAPICVETQVVINPGFDSSDNDKEPWTGGGFLIHDGVYSYRNALSMFFQNGGGQANVAQTLSNLDGNYKLSYRYTLASAVNVFAGFSCTIQPQIGGVSLPSADLADYSGWTLETQTWPSGSQPVAQAELLLSLSCSGEYEQLTINLDDITLTRVCGPQAS
ncbi:hypothetical protein F53441_8165 [Fusarium austroafricanum]|uniref:CBM-cenC domain-containing protein n=1 Tax=Fusarium austroafricanum TaxID=2364996 RepID=A0A8H4P502_9HYPO|nr:hypothetical protein F53441_8165 [Fusarium austroafricanum]